MIQRAIDFANFIISLLGRSGERPLVLVSYSENPQPRTDAIVISAGAVYAYGTNYDGHIAQAVCKFYNLPYDLELPVYALDTRLINECLRSI